MVLGVLRRKESRELTVESCESGGSLVGSKAASLPSASLRAGGMTVLDGSSGSGVGVFGPFQCGERLDGFAGFLLGEAKLVEAL